MEHFAGIDAIVHIVERCSGPVQRLDRDLLHGRPIHHLLAPRSIQRVQGRIGATTLVRRVLARHARMDIHDPPCERAPGRTSSSRMTRSPSNTTTSAPSSTRVSCRRRSKSLLPATCSGGTPRVPTVGGRHAEQEVVQGLALHLQVCRIEPLLPGTIGETVVLDFPGREAAPRRRRRSRPRARRHRPAQSGSAPPPRTPVPTSCTRCSPLYGTYWPALSAAAFLRDQI